VIGRWMDRGLPSAGLWTGPVAWLVSTQANYSLASADCETDIAIVALVALGLVAISLFGAFLSWRALTASGERLSAVPWRDGHPHRFLAAIGIAMAFLFALTIALQGTAGLFLSGCER
jgi:hypothetical protein